MALVVLVALVALVVLVALAVLAVLVALAVLARPAGCGFPAASRSVCCCSAATRRLFI